MCGLLGLPFVPEGFADRRYRPDGLVGRLNPGAVGKDDDSRGHALLMI